MSRHLLLIFLLLLQLGCKQRADSSSERSSGDSNECKYAPPNPYALKLQADALDLFEQYLAQNVSFFELQERMQEKISFLPEEDVTNAIGFTAGMMHAKLQDISLPAVYRLGSGQSLKNEERKRLLLAGYTIEDLQQQALEMGGFIKCLSAANVRLTSENTWDLTEAKLSHEALSQNACLLGAVSYFISSQVLAGVAEQERQAIQLGNYIVPVCSPLKVLPVKDWHASVESRLNSINREMADFLAASGELGTYSGIIKGRVFERPWLPGVKTIGEWVGASSVDANEISREMAYKALLNHRRALQCLGTPPQLNQAIDNIMKSLIEIDNKNVKAALEHLANAEFAVYTIPLALAAAHYLPVLGGVVGPTLAIGVMASTTATTVNGIRLVAALSGLGIVAKTGIDVSNSGLKNISCLLGEHIARGGASFLPQIPLMLALPFVTVGAGTVAGERILRGTDVGALQGILYAQQITAAVFTLNQVRQMTPKFVTCRDYLKKSSETAANIRNDHDADLMAAQVGEAIKMCAGAGLDVGFLGLQAKNFQKGYKAIKEVKLRAANLNGRVNSIEDLKGYVKDYFKDGKDAEFWVNFQESHPGKRIGGLTQGAYLVDGPSGQKLVFKTFKVDKGNLAPVLRNFENMQDWARKGEGLKIEGIGIRQKGEEVTMTIVTEFYFDGKPGGNRILAGGDGHDFMKVIKESGMSKTAARKTGTLMMSLLDHHDDPHLGNVLVRVMEMNSGVKPVPKSNQIVDGNRLIEVVKIDPDRFFYPYAQFRKWYRDNSVPNAVVPYLPNKLSPHFGTRGWQQKLINEAIELEAID